MNFQITQLILIVINLLLLFVFLSTLVDQNSSSTSTSFIDTKSQNSLDQIKLPVNITEKVSSLKVAPHNQQDRLKIFGDACQRYRQSKGELYWQEHIPPSNSPSDVVKTFKDKSEFLYYPKFQTAYCFPPKAGTTNWRRMLTAIKLNMTIDDLIKNTPLDIVYSSIPSMKVWRQKLGSKSNNPDIINFRKHKEVKHGVILGRHPLVRIHSAWAHRLSNSNPRHAKSFSRQINLIKKSYERDGDFKQPEGIFVTLAGFIRFLTSSEAFGKYSNVHWMTVTDLCQPCEFGNFDHVFTTETADADASEYMKEIGYDYVGPFPTAYGKDTAIGINRGVQQTSDVVQHFKDIQNYYLKAVPKEILMDFKNKYFRWDFELFGYDLEGFVE